MLIGAGPDAFGAEKGWNSESPSSYERRGRNSFAN